MSAFDVIPSESKREKDFFLYIYIYLKGETCLPNFVQRFSKGENKKGGRVLVYLQTGGRKGIRSAAFDAIKHHL